MTLRSRLRPLRNYARTASTTSGREVLTFSSM
jgi:hypothetical protein